MRQRDAIENDQQQFPSHGVRRRAVTRRFGQRIPYKIAYTGLGRAPGLHAATDDRTANANVTVKPFPRSSTACPESVSLRQCRRTRTRRERVKSIRCARIPAARTGRTAEFGSRCTPSTRHTLTRSPSRARNITRRSRVTLHPMQQCSVLLINLKKKK